MKKPPLSVALSASLALLQANLLPALSEPASPSIWQKLATPSASTPAVKTGSSTVKKKSVAHVANATKTSKVASTSSSASGIASGAINGHAMLFLSGKNKDSGSTAPAAALTIHPALPLNTDQQVASASDNKPTLVAMNGEIPTDLPSTSNVPTTTAAPAPKQLLAQLAPDQVVAQADSYAPTNATPIPPVVSGTVDLEEFKPSNVIDLKVSQSRTFRLKNKIVRTSISEPSIAEPVVVAENELVLLGKAAGQATLIVWDDAGNSITVDLRVSRDFSSLQSTLREIDPRIIVKPFTVGGSDRVILLGDVDHAESVIRAFSAANAFMDDRGMKIIAANSRLLDAKPGEGGGGGGGGGGGQTGQLAQLSQVDKYTFFNNMSGNVAKAQTIVSDGGRVTSLIKVRKTPLIVLHVTFLEMNTSATRELGVQLGATVANNSFSFGIGGQNSLSANSVNQLPFLSSSPGMTSLTSNGGQQLQINGTPVGGFPITGPFTVMTTASTSPTLTPVSLVNAASAVTSNIGLGALAVPSSLLGQAALFGAPGGAVSGGSVLQNLFQAASNFGRSSRFSINPTVDGLISEGRARVLSEPTLVTISGERAAFLAGGEIPIQQSIATAGAALSSTTFEPFGLRLNFVPVLLENGVINLEVAPEERILSQTLAQSVGGASVPGFTTRKMQTIVELRPGQELFLGGLVSANSGRNLNKTPILGEIPVLGALWKSKAFSKNESELVVSVRPEIILPGTPGQLKLPEEISRVEGPRDMNMLQVEPTMIDERYMTSGRVERSQRIPGILPPGSPIPDSQ